MNQIIAVLFFILPACALWGQNKLNTHNLSSQDTISFAACFVPNSGNGVGEVFKPALN